MTEKNEKRFEIGDSVWRVDRNCQETWVTCPDCGGTKTLKVVLFDGTEYIIDCAGCAAGYEPPRGVVRIVLHTSNAAFHTVTGVSIDGDDFEYKLSGGYYVKGENVCATKDEALAKAEILCAEWDEEQRRKVFRKEKDTRSWSWHVHYHRRNIREAQRQLEYHTQKLNVAKAKSKEDIGQEKQAS